MIKFIVGVALGYALAVGAFDDYVQVDVDRAVTDAQEILKK